MGARGPKSSAELSTIGPEGIATVRRPEAPAELSAEAAEVWQRVVNCKPADWFDAAAQPVLAQLCRHIVAARRVGQLITQEEASDEFTTAEYDKLLRAQERQSGIVKALATSLRLTPQSRYTPATAGRKGTGGTGPKPWEA